MSKYKEIFKLKKMLEAEGIPFEFFDRFDDMVPEGKREKMRELCPDFEHYQLCYPSDDNRWISVIEGIGSYGGSEDLLEIMGGDKPYDRYKNGGPTVQGFLTARTVFNKIKKHYGEEVITWKKW